MSQDMLICGRTRPVIRGSGRWRGHAPSRLVITLGERRAGARAVREVHDRRVDVVETIDQGGGHLSEARSEEQRAVEEGAFNSMYRRLN